MPKVKVSGYRKEADDLDQTVDKQMESGNKKNESEKSLTQMKKENNTEGEAVDGVKGKDFNMSHSSQNLLNGERNQLEVKRWHA